MSSPTIKEYNLMFLDGEGNIRSSWVVGKNNQQAIQIFNALKKNSWKFVKLNRIPSTHSKEVKEAYLTRLLEEMNKNAHL